MTASASVPREVEVPTWLTLYPGTVVSDEDPDKSGYLQIRVDQVYGKATEDEKIEDDDLPWAKPLFPVSGVKSGEFFVPPVGATVWVMFWGGSGEKPVWVGGWFTPDDVPDAAKSSYDPGPKTRIVRTPTGHVFEMRWKQDEEQIHLDTAAGNKIKMLDADALGGPKVELETTGGFRLSVDEKNKKVEIVTPGGRSVVLDDDNEKVTITTTKHSLELDDAGGKVKLDAMGDIEVTATGDITETATGDAEVDGVNVSIIATALLKLVGAQVTIGNSGGPHFKLMDERLIVLLNAMVAAYNIHVHGLTPPPLPIMVPVVVDTANTLITKGD